MNANPYTPPKAKLADRPKPPGSPIKAVLLGLGVDIGGSLLIGTALGFFYAISLAMSGMNQAQIHEAVTNVSSGSWISVIGMAGGCISSVLGGCPCARVSRRDDYKLGFVLAAISSIVGLLYSYNSHSVPVLALSVSLTIDSVLIGTRIGRSKS